MTRRPVPRKLRHAARLSSRQLPPGLPPVLVFTDPVRGAPVLELADSLPPGWGVVFRHFGAKDRAETAARLARIAVARHLKLLIGADPELARSVGADGVHWPEARIADARKWAGRFALMTASAHSPDALFGKPPVGIDARVFSTVFPSRSPSAGDPRGAIRFRRLCARARLPVYGLGGITPANAPQICRSSGLAGVSLLD